MKHRSRIFLAALFILVGLAFLCACSQAPYPNEIDPKLSDRDWFVGKPCEIPCWHGLTPGVSKSEEIIKVLKGLKFLNANKIEEKEVPVTIDQSGGTVPIIEVSAYYFNPRDLFGVEIHIVDNVFYDMHLFLNYQISLDEVVQKIGEPDGYFVGRAYPENKGCDLSVFWLSQNMIISLAEERRSYLEKDLCAKTRQSDGKIPTGLRFDNIHIVKNDQMKYLATPIFPWKGFETRK